MASTYQEGSRPSLDLAADFVIWPGLGGTPEPHPEIDGIIVAGNVLLPAELVSDDVEELRRDRMQANRESDRAMP